MTHNSSQHLLKEETCWRNVQLSSLVSLVAVVLMMVNFLLLTGVVNPLPVITKSEGRPLINFYSEFKKERKFPQNLHLISTKLEKRRRIFTDFKIDHDKDIVQKPVQIKNLKI